LDKLRKIKPLLTTEEKWEAATKPFTQHAQVYWESLNLAERTPQFMEEKLLTATSRLNNKKAPGPDGIAPEVIKLTVEKCTQPVLTAMTTYCWRVLIPLYGKRPPSF